MANTIHVLDDYYLAITLLITIGYQLAFFSVAFSFKFDKLTGECGAQQYKQNTRQHSTTLSADGPLSSRLQTPKAREEREKKKTFADHMC
jgi:hypothetical protein